MEKITQEIIDANLAADLGYLYMGMGMCNGHRVCMSVAYKMDYCIDKAIQFEEASNDIVKFDHVNKVKYGDVEAEVQFGRVSCVVASL